MKIERTPTILTVRESPGIMWLFGSFFIVVGALFVYGASGGYNNFDEMSFWVMAAHILLGTCAVAAGTWVIYTSPLTVIKIDRNTETLTLHQSGLGGRNTRVFTFDEVKGYSVLEDYDSDGDPVWSLQLETKEGELIRCSLFAGTVREFTSDIAFELTAFMYKQMPSTQDLKKLEDESTGPIS
ncbi:MAG: hypothetical protein H0V76_12735 [Blastocatellia bacterium]|nr:hypothetical protein [Blastocatellia bacterium]